MKKYTLYFARVPFLRVSFCPFGRCLIDDRSTAVSSDRLRDRVSSGLVVPIRFVRVLVGAATREMSSNVLEHRCWYVRSNAHTRARVPSGLCMHACTRVMIYMCAR